MHTELFTGTGQAVDAQDEAGEYPRDIVAQHIALAKAEGIGAEACRLLKPVAKGGQRGNAVLPYLPIADREAEVVAFFNVIHVVSFSAHA